MIHIIRENETIEDIAHIYDVSIEKIMNYNADNSFCVNASIWVDSGGVVGFNEITKEIELGPYYKFEGLNLSMINKVESLNESFVPVDNWARDCKQVFIDGYDVDNERNELNLPYDYPSINACSVNNIVPSFVLCNIAKYESDFIINMLLNDLSFKEYKNVLIIVKKKDELASAKKLKNVLKNDGFGVFAAMEYNLIKNCDYLSGFDLVYYMTEKNIIDFDSFVQKVSDLIWLMGNDNLGLLYTPRFVDINKANNEISYLNMADVRKIADVYKIDKINFDEDSQLCWMRYTKDNFVHSLLFEDYRTFYAKASFLKENQIKNICFNECSAYANVLGKIFGIVK